LHYAIKLKTFVTLTSQYEIVTLISTVLLCHCETWSRTLNDEINIRDVRKRNVENI